MSDVSKKQDALHAANQEIRRLQVELKRSDKQKQELLQGFRKQMQLIDVLKRKSLHLEAAKVLAITEDEFIRCLDWKQHQQRC